METKCKLLHTTWLASIKNFVVSKILITTVFLVCALIICLLELPLYLIIRPCSHRLYRKVDNFLVTHIAYTFPVFVFQWWADLKLEIVADPTVVENFVGKEHAMILLNHTYDFDWLLTHAVANHFGKLGNFRFFSKKSIQHVPLVGWSWKLHENIMVDRNWEKDQKVVSRELRDLIVNNEPGFIISFPEGTRRTPQKHSVSVKVAKEKGLPELKHLLLPRTRGFVECIKVLKRLEIIDQHVAIYDATMAVVPSKQCGNSSPNIMSMLSGKSAHVKIFLKRYVVADIPDTEADCAAWLHEKFCEKDQLIENISKSGKFICSEEERERYKGFETIKLKKSPYILANFLVSCVLTIGLLLWLVGKFALNSGMVYYASTLGLLTACGYFALQYYVKSGQIEAASSYGLLKN